MAYERVLGEKNEKKKIRLQKVAFKYCDLTHMYLTSTIFTFFMLLNYLLKMRQILSKLVLHHIILPCAAHLARVDICSQMVFVQVHCKCRFV